MWLGRHERFEHLFQLMSWDAGPVSRTVTRTRWSSPPRSRPSIAAPLPALTPSHRTRSTQVQQDLLQLHAIAGNGRQRGLGADGERHAASDDSLAREVEDLPDDLVQCKGVRGRSPGAAGRRHVDDVSRAAVVLRDIIEDVAHLGEVGRSYRVAPRRPALARIDVSGWFSSCARATESSPTIDNRSMWAN